MFTKEEAADWFAILRTDMAGHMDQGMVKLESAVMGGLGQKMQKMEADSMRQFSEHSAMLADVQQRVKVLENERPILRAKVAELESGFALAESAATHSVGHG